MPAIFLWRGELTSRESSPGGRGVLGDDKPGRGGRGRGWGCCVGAGRAEGGGGGGGKAKQAGRNETGEIWRQRPLKEEGEEAAGTRFFWGGRSKCVKYRTKYAGRCFWGGGDFVGKSKKIGWKKVFGVGKKKNWGGGIFGKFSPKNLWQNVGKKNVEKFQKKNFVTNFKKKI